MSKFARSFYYGLEKSYLLLTLENSIVRGGRRAPNKVSDFCDFSIICEKLEKSQILLELENSSVRGGRGASPKSETSAIFAISQKLRKLEKSQNLLKLVNSSVKEVEGCPPNSAISAIFPKIAKNWKNPGVRKLVKGGSEIRI